MLTKALKWTSIGTLLAAFLYSSRESQSLWSVNSGGYLELFELVVWLSALVVAVQAIRTGSYSYFWAAGFAAIVVLFNPFAPFTLARSTFLWMDLVCIVMFVLSLAGLRTQPRPAASPAAVPLWPGR
jgi:hypothetical protein